MIKILLAVDIFDQSNPPDCDMQAPFRAPPRAARGSSSRGYRTPSPVRSQMPAALVSRALLAARSEVPDAIAPAATALHGPSQGRENAGGNSTESREATTTSAPRPAIATSHPGPRSRERSRAAVMRSPPIAARAATRDQWPLLVQAPNAPEPGPNRLHGSAVPRTAATNAASESILTPRPGRGGLGSTVSSASGPRTSARHSLPKLSPRTGVEHARHIGRPHPSHRATAGLPGCRSHRSRTFDERSSGGTSEGYRHPGGGIGEAERSARATCQDARDVRPVAEP